MTADVAPSAFRSSRSAQACLHWPSPFEARPSGEHLRVTDRERRRWQRPPIVRRRDRAYLGGKVTAMPETAAVAPAFSRPLLIVAATAGIVLAGTAALWAYYGTAVFYE